LADAAEQKLGGVKAMPHEELREHFWADAFRGSGGNQARSGAGQNPTGDKIAGAA
jgi:hypothetical protein